MIGSGQSERMAGVIALLALILVALLASRTTVAARTWRPPRIPAAACQPWMAECLDGVGPKTAERAAAAIRRGDIQALPRPAREQASAWFAGCPVPDARSVIQPSLLIRDPLFPRAPDVPAATPAIK